MAAFDVLAPGRVAVVTGAASGIGLALCQRLAAEGLRVVMADTEWQRLETATARLAAEGATVLPVVTDVSRPEQVDGLRDCTMDWAGAVHLVCNNAGVSCSGRSVWETSREEWEWVLGVNLLGVVHGIRSFVPALLEEGGHVVNTASIAGLTAGSMGPYSVTKHAVVALSEALFLELVRRGAPIGVSVLCPGWVRTRIAQWERHRPGLAVETTEETRARGRRVVRDMVRSAIDPADVASAAVDAVRTGRFYVLTHPHLDDGIRRRAEAILAGGPPAAGEPAG
jgi:NAD(P)-dependent dehydrogenase (short-subunit alcohol dehydrogenase family)